MIRGAVGQVSGDERLDRAVARAIADKNTPAERCPVCFNAVGSLDCRCAETIAARVRRERELARPALRIVS